MPLSSNDLRLTVTEHFANEDELIARLEIDDPTPDFTNPKYLYRGQEQRHFRRWPPEAQNGYVQDQVHIESVISTDYRGFEDWIRDLASKDHMGLMDWIRDCQRSHTEYPERACNSFSQVKAAMAFIVVYKHSLILKDNAIDAWVQALRTPTVESFARMGSVAQHYATQTAYLDATSDYYVALRMATHDFKSGNYSTGKGRVIYRFERSKLLAAEKAVNAGPLAACPQGLQCHHVSIIDTPPQLAARASLQRGWSLINTESPHLVDALLQEGAIEALTFDSPTKSVRNCLSTDDVTPAEPLIDALFKKYEVVDPHLEYLQWWLNTHVNSVVGTNLDIKDPAWLIDFLTYYR